MNPRHKQPSKLEECPVRAKAVVFDYPFKRVLRGLTFDLPRQSITALVGPNGAGKTTLMRCLAALQEPLSGDIWVNGLNVRDNPRQVHRQIGFLADSFGVYEELSVTRCLLYAARSRSVPPSMELDRLHTVAEWLGLTGYLNTLAGQLSRGYRQRLAIAQAMIHQPSLLILDEPASGLDPEARYELAQIFLMLRQQGMTLLVSSHILSELQDYSTHMLILRDGLILDFKAIHTTLVGSRQLCLSLSEPWTFGPEYFQKQAAVAEVICQSQRILFHFSGDETAQQELLRTLILDHVPVCGLAEVKADFQSTYLEKVSGQKHT